MSVAVASRCRRVGVRSAQVRRDATCLLEILGIDAELSIALVGDDEMQALNARYRKKDRPTDVLSFASDEDEVRCSPREGEAPAEPLRRAGSAVHVGSAGGSPSHVGGHTQMPPPLLGDVVISLDTAARQAAERDVPLDDEIRFLLAHGILHLLGYDHERSPAEARRMFAKQRSLLRKLAGMKA